jgi:D-glycero-beta-D-manno-heptose-7-phosphate kinase
VSPFGNLQDVDFSGVRVVLVGDLVLDRFVHGTTRRVSREAPVPVIQFEREELAPGGAANCAANIASLGGQVSVVGLLGDDVHGDALRRLLDDLGVDTSGIVCTPGRLTTVKTRVLAGGQGTVHQQVLRLDREPVVAASAEARSALLDALAERANNAHVVVVSDYGYGSATPAEVCAAGDAAVVVDSRRDLGTYHGAHTLKPNLSELEGFAGCDLHSEASIVEAAQQLRTSAHAASVLVTLGREGMLLVEADGTTRIPVFGDDEVADVTGAGDSVLAAYSLGLGLGWSRAEAARLATVAGGVAVSHQGTYAVTPSDLRDLVREHG